MAWIHKPSMQAILGKHPEYRPRIYIETGLWRGDQINMSEEFFDKVHGIELDQHWWRFCRRRFRNKRHVTIHQGDTRTVLPPLLRRYVIKPCFFYLDAHFHFVIPPVQRSEFPLWRELEAIKRKPTKDIVVIDDVHNFGKKREDLKFTPDAVEWETVTKESLLGFFDGRVHDSMHVEDGFVIWKKE